MTIAIPVWLMWVLGAVGGVLAIAGIGILIGLAIMGAACVKAFGGGMRW